MVSRLLLLQQRGAVYVRVVVSCRVRSMIIRHQAIQLRIVHLVLA
jgi:hypothetical protein